MVLPHYDIESIKEELINDGIEIIKELGFEVVILESKTRPIKDVDLIMSKLVIAALLILTIILL